jgi:hypothetical protein
MVSQYRHNLPNARCSHQVRSQFQRRQARIRQERPEWAQDVIKRNCSNVNLLGINFERPPPCSMKPNYSHIPRSLVEFVLREEMFRDAVASVYNVLVWELGDEGKRAEMAYKRIAFDIVVS